MTTGKTQTQSIYNVRDYGASGRKENSAQSAIQSAIDACSAAGGGMVYLPPGDYTSGTIHLRSRVRFFLEAGATLYSSKAPADFDKRGLFYGEDLDSVTLEGRGVVNGQAEYDWRLMEDFHDWYIYPNQQRWEAAGLPLMRSFPTPNSIGNLVLMIRCQNLRITGLTFLDSPSWTMHLWGCERVVIDGVSVFTSLKYGVWADGIDPDGCKDVHISNCTIQTGDDALVFYSSSIFGPARPCENITVTNCRLSSASSALKFCDGNQNAIRNVTISNCVITGSNRGIAFMLFDGGVLENIIITNITIECGRFDWYWWGDGDPLHFNLIRRSEIDPNIDKTTEPPIGSMRNIILRDILARGVGPCLIHGSPDSPIENVTLDNVRIEVLSEADSPLQKSPNAMTFEHIRGLRLRDVILSWQPPAAPAFQRALLGQHIDALLLDNVTMPPPPHLPDGAGAVFEDVTSFDIRNSRV